MMNRKTLVEVLKHFKDDHTSFYVWMHGYLSAGNVEDKGESVCLTVDEEGSATPIQGQWLTWMRDHPKGLVEVQLRNGKIIRRNADTFNWHPNFRDPSQDIVAYRILDE